MVCMSVYVCPYLYTVVKQRVSRAGWIEKATKKNNRQNVCQTKLLLLELLLFSKLLCHRRMISNFMHNEMRTCFTEIKCRKSIYMPRGGLGDLTLHFMGNLFYLPLSDNKSWDAADSNTCVGKHGLVKGKSRKFESFSYCDTKAHLVLSKSAYHYN